MNAGLCSTICEILGIAPEQIKEYPASQVTFEQDQIFLCKIGSVKKIVASGGGTLYYKLRGDSLTDTVKLCPLTHENRLILNEYLPYTVPTAFGRQIATIGLGDRLGLATPGHIRCFPRDNVKPILAQQSKRELDLTGRSYEQVLDDVCFAVFQEGYNKGFGADGDHLKTISDIETALECGYTMITLDCSEKIGKGIREMTTDQAAEAYGRLPLDYRLRLETTFLGKGFLINFDTFFFSKEELVQCALVYHAAIDFASEVYFNCLVNAVQEVDFELSVDETESITTVQGHLFVAMELEAQNVLITSLAPRFIGEFQKGIDYIGDKTEFEEQLKQHAAIADHFGYKLSIHSGSDKFSVFQIIGKHTRGRLHLKTSGTNWLEAVGTIIDVNPSLYRKIHQKALQHFQLAKSLYHVSGDSQKILALDSCKDDDLVDYLSEDNSRQLLHITYGYVLGDAALKEELYHTLQENEDYYFARLISHIGRHLDLCYRIEE